MFCMQSWSILFICSKIFTQIYNCLMPIRIRYRVEMQKFLHACADKKYQFSWDELVMCELTGSGRNVLSWRRAEMTKSKGRVIWSAGTRRVGRVNQPHLKLQMTTEPTWSYDCTITWRFQEADDGRSTAVGLAEQ